MKLNGHTTIVTGAGRGIGRGIAHVLAREGARVALVARTDKQLNQVLAEIEGAGGTALSIPTDVSDPAAVSQMVEKVLQECGQIDSLVNNAGLFSAPGPLWESDSADWWNDVKINLLGFYWYHAQLAGIYGNLGRQKEAQTAVDKLLELYPEFAANARMEVRKWQWHDEEVVEQAVRDWQNAGLDIPDEPEDEGYRKEDPQAAAGE